MSSSQDGRLDLGRSSCLCHSAVLKADSSWGLVCWVTECCCVKEPFTEKLTAQESSPLQISSPRGLMLKSPNSQEVARPQRPEVEELQSFCPGWEPSPIDSQEIMGLVGPQPKDNFATVTTIWPASALVQHTAVSQRENSQPASKTQCAVLCFLELALELGFWSCRVASSVEQGQGAGGQ